MRFKEYLIEMSMKQINVSDIVNKKMISLLDSSQLEGYLYSYKYENDIEEEDDFDDEDIMDSDEFIEFVQDQLEDRFHDVQYDIGATIKGGYITIYRDMTVKSNWFKNLEKHKHLGIYWSWDKGAARAHWGKFEKEYKTIKMVSKIKEVHVDWLDTFALNLDPSIGEDEREIRLFKNTPIKLDAIWLGGKKIDISNIKDKVFRA